MKITYKEILALIFAVIVLYYILKPKSEKIEEKEENKQQTQLTNIATDKKVKFAFNKTAYAAFLKQEKYNNSATYLKTKGLKSTDISKTCELIKDCEGTFNDDEDTLYSIFRAIPNLTIFSMVSNIFNYKYKVDLQMFLVTFMNESEMNKLYKIIIAKYYL
jgi:hypothetical protein